MKKNVEDILSLLAVVLLTTILAICVYNFWNWDITVPIVWRGDSITDLGALSISQKAIRGDEVYIAHTAGTPFAMEKNYYVVDGSLHFLLIKILSFFIRTPGLLMNVYYLFTFPATAAVMFFVLRRLNINRWISVWISIAYTFLPGRFYRSVAHLTIGSSFTLPLVCLGGILLLEGTLCKKQYVKQDIKSISDLFKSACSINMLIAAIGSALVGLSSLYHCCFSMIIYFVAMILAFIENKRKRNLFYGSILLGIDFIVAGICVGIPAILSEGRMLSNIASTRHIADVSQYGLKLSQMLLPISNHRIGLLNDIRSYYDMNFPLNENMWSSIGLTLSIGFIITIFAAVTRKANKFVTNIGELNLLLICISMIGGISEIIAMIFSYIRCYNRMSFFIAAFSGIALAYCMDGFYKNHKEKIPKIIGIIVVICGIGIAVYDQTSEDFALSKEHAQIVSDLWERMDIFFKDIENTDQKILMYPSVYSEEYQESLDYKYENMTPYVHSATAEYTNGYQKDSQTDIWLKALEMYSDENKIRLAIGAGFDGILLYCNGFKDFERYEELDESLESLLHNRKAVEEDGWVYYSFSDYKQSINAEITEELKEACMDIGKSYMHLPYSLGQHLNFMDADMETYFMSGFSYREENGFFTLGNRAEVKLNVLDNNFGDLWLHMEFAAVYTGSQRVCVYVGENKVWEGDIVLEENGAARLDCDIPRNFITDRQIDLVFEFPDAISPLEYEGYPDDRLLAIKFSNMTVADTRNNVMDVENKKDDILKNFLN